MASRKTSPTVPKECTSFPKAFLNSYECFSRIGKGSFATVYKCKNRTTETMYAAKVVTVCRVPKSSLNNVINEVAVMNILNNENILKIHEYYDSPGHKIMVLSHLPKADILPQRLAKKQFLSETEIAALLWGVGNGLAEAHRQNIVHRDIKPANLFVQDPHDFKTIQIGDFGLSKVSKTRLKKPCGTIMYMAPEFFKDIISYGPPIDVWALAVTALYLFVGHHPFHNFYKMNLDRMLANPDISSKITRFSLSVNGYKYYTKLSAGLQSLLSGMFHHSQIKRTTAAQVLQHPFIIRCTMLATPKHSGKHFDESGSKAAFLPENKEDGSGTKSSKFLGGQLMKDLFTPALGSAFSLRARRNTRHIVSEMKLLQGWRNSCDNERRVRRKNYRKSNHRSQADWIPRGMSSDAFIKEFNEDSALLSRMRTSWRASHAFLSPKEFKDVFKKYSKGGMMKCSDFENFVQTECTAGGMTCGVDETKRVYQLGDITGKGHLDYADFSRFFAPSELAHMNGSTSVGRGVVTAPTMKASRPIKSAPARTSQLKHLLLEAPSLPEEIMSLSPLNGKRRKNKNAQVPVKAPRVLTKAPKLTTKVDVDAFESEFCDRMTTLLSQHVVVSANLQKGLRREATFWKQRLFGVRDVSVLSARGPMPSESGNAALTVNTTVTNKLPKL